MKKGLSALPRAGRVFIERILEQHDIRVTRFIRNTQRFFVAEAQYQGKRSLFKACVYPRSRDPWTNRKFGKEILFLQFLATSKHPTAKSAAPHIYAGALGTRSWYVREYIEGTTYNINNGNIRFQNVFFTTENRRSVVAAFNDLQSITKQELPRNLSTRLKRYDQTAYARKLLDRWWGRIAVFLDDPRAKQDLPMILEERRKQFDRTHAVLTHQEPYACHFIRVNGRLRLIDWENIAWANPVHDYTNVWMRAANHPAWQSALEEDARRSTRKTLGKHFDCVWDTSILIKCLFNILSFPYYKEKRDFRQLHALSQRIAKQQLRAWRKM